MPYTRLRHVGSDVRLRDFDPGIGITLRLRVLQPLNLGAVQCFIALAAENFKRI